MKLALLPICVSLIGIGISNLGFSEGLLDTTFNDHAILAKPHISVGGLHGESSIKNADNLNRLVQTQSASSRNEVADVIIKKLTFVTETKVYLQKINDLLATDVYARKQKWIPALPTQEDIELRQIRAVGEDGTQRVISHIDEDLFNYVQTFRNTVDTALGGLEITGRGEVSFKQNIPNVTRISSMDAAFLIQLIMNNDQLINAETGEYIHNDAMRTLYYIQLTKMALGTIKNAAEFIKVVMIAKSFASEFSGSVKVLSKVDKVISGVAPLLDAVQIVFDVLNLKAAQTDLDRTIAISNLTLDSIAAASGLGVFLLPSLIGAFADLLVPLAGLSIGISGLVQAYAKVNYVHEQTLREFGRLISALRSPYEYKDEKLLTFKTAIEELNLEENTYVLGSDYIEEISGGVGHTVSGGFDHFFRSPSTNIGHWLEVLPALTAWDNQVKKHGKLSRTPSVVLLPSQPATYYAMAGNEQAVGIRYNTELGAQTLDAIRAYYPNRLFWRYYAMPTDWMHNIAYHRLSYKDTNVQVRLSTDQNKIIIPGVPQGSDVSEQVKETTRAMLRKMHYVVQDTGGTNHISFAKEQLSRVELKSMSEQANWNFDITEIVAELDVAQLSKVISISGNNILINGITYATFLDSMPKEIKFIRYGNSQTDEHTIRITLSLTDNTQTVSVYSNLAHADYLSETAMIEKLLLTLQSDSNTQRIIQTAFMIEIDNNVHININIPSGTSSQPIVTLIFSDMRALNVELLSNLYLLRDRISWLHNLDKIKIIGHGNIKFGIGGIEGIESDIPFKSVGNIYLKDKLLLMSTKYKMPQGQDRTLLHIEHFDSENSFTPFSGVELNNLDIIDITKEANDIMILSTAKLKYKEGKALLAYKLYDDMQFHLTHFAEIDPLLVVPGKVTNLQNGLSFMEFVSFLDNELSNGRQLLSFSTYIDKFESPIRNRLNLSSLEQSDIQASFKWYNQASAVVTYQIKEKDGSKLKAAHLPVIDLRGNLIGNLSVSDAIATYKPLLGMQDQQLQLDTLFYQLKDFGISEVIFALNELPFYHMNWRWLNCRLNMAYIVGQNSQNQTSSLLSLKGFSDSFTYSIDGSDLIINAGMANEYTFEKIRFTDVLGYPNRYRIVSQNLYLDDYNPREYDPLLGLANIPKMLKPDGN